jgi:hypothetical protein
MKRVLILGIFSILSLTIKGQITIDGKDISSDSTLTYIEIVGADIGLFKKKLVVVVDYGQKFSIWDGKDSAVKGPDGKNYIFNTMVDALNFFSRNGWTYENSYAISVPNSGNVYRFLLKRK